MTDHTSIAEQADEVGREVRQRERLYPRWMRETDRAGRPRITQETAERKLAAMRAAERTLRFVAQHAIGLRALAHFLISAPADAPPIPTQAEKEALLAHPAVKALLEAWPEAEVRIHGAPPIEAPEQQSLFEGEPGEMADA